MKFFCAILFLLFFSLSTFSQAPNPETFNLQVEGQITNSEDDPMIGAMVQVYQGSKLINTYPVDNKGKYSFQLPLNNEYLITVSAPRTVQKKFMVSTRGVPPERTGKKFSIIKADLSLFEKTEDVDYSILNQPLQKYMFIGDKSDFGYDEAYFDQMLSGLQKLREMEEAAKNKKRELEANYQAAIKTADKAFQKKDWTTAKASYNQASKLKPAENYPKDQLAQIESIIKDQEALNKKTADDAAAKAAADAAAKAKAEADKLAADKAAADAKAKAEADKAAADKLAKDKAAADAAAKAKAEADKLAADKAAADAKAKAEADKAAADKLAKDKAAADAAAKAKAEADKLAADAAAKAKAESDKLAADKAAADAAAKAKAEADKLAADKTAADAAAKAKAEADKAAADKLAKDKAAADAAAKAKAEADKLAADKAAADKLAKDKAAADAAAKAKAEADKLAADKAAADAAAKAKADADNAAKAKHSTLPTLGVDRYKEAITKADGLFKTKRYKEAKTSYEEALIVKAGDAYAKSKLAEIEKLLNSDTAVAQEVDAKMKALLAKYPPGVTEETISGTGVVIIQRVVVKESSAYVYQKKIFSWGGISYFRNSTAITESTFESETKP